MTANEIDKKGLFVEKPKALTLICGRVTLECGYRIDLIIEPKHFAEVNSAEILNETHLTQILTYLSLSGCKSGLLITLIHFFSKMAFNILSIVPCYACANLRETCV